MAAAGVWAVDAGESVLGVATVGGCDCWTAEDVWLNESMAHSGTAGRNAWVATLLRVLVAPYQCDGELAIANDCRVQGGGEGQMDSRGAEINGGDGIVEVDETDDGGA